MPGIGLLERSSDKRLMVTLPTFKPRKGHCFALLVHESCIELKYAHGEHRSDNLNEPLMEAMN